MALRMIKKDQWKNYFDQVSKLIRGERIEIEVAGLDVGDQIEEEWAPLDGITYDAKSDTLFVHTPPLDHSIDKPQDIIASEDGIVVRSIAVKDAEGHVQVLNFREPLKLEAGRGATQNP